MTPSLRPVISPASLLIGIATLALILTPAAPTLAQIEPARPAASVAPTPADAALRLHLEEQMARRVRATRVTGAVTILGAAILGIALLRHVAGDGYFGREDDTSRGDRAWMNTVYTGVGFTLGGSLGVLGSGLARSASRVRLRRVTLRAAPLVSQDLRGIAIHLAF